MINTEDWNNNAENSAAITGINDTLKYIKTIFQILLYF